MEREVGVTRELPSPHLIWGKRCEIDIVKRIQNIVLMLHVCYSQNVQAVIHIKPESEYKYSLAFRVRRYVVIATKPVHRLQIRPMVHN